MTALAFTATIAVVVGVLLWRAWQKRTRRHAWLMQPGRTPERAITYRRFDQIDEAVRTARCPLCEGRYSVLSEGSTLGEIVGRVVHMECVQCEEEADLFFREEELLH